MITFVWPVLVVSAIAAVAAVAASSTLGTGASRTTAVRQPTAPQPTAPRLPPPLLVAVDQEGGSVKRFADGPPDLSPPAIGHSGDPQLAYREGLATGRYLRRAGIKSTRSCSPTRAFRPTTRRESRAPCRAESPTRCCAASSGSGA